MTISLTHKKVSAVADTTDATLIQPSNWNDQHTLICSSSVVLGRVTAGDGAVEEIALSGFATTAQLANKADKATTLSGYGITDGVSTSALGAASGVATLGSDSKLSASQIPDISIVTYLGGVASQSAMLALTGQQGDWCTRSDLGTNWIITGANPALLASWTQLSYPTAPVISVNSKTGAVNLTSADVGAQAALGYTPVNKAGDTMTGNLTVPSLNGGQLAGTRNRIINGNMAIDQRNAGAAQIIPANTALYALDRWVVYAAGANQTVQQASASDVGFQYGLQVTGAAGATAFNFVQRIESKNIADCAGKTVTLSFKVYNSSSSATMSAFLYYPNATDNYSSSTYFDGIVLTIPNGWSTQSCTFVVNSNCTKGLSIELNCGALGAGVTRIITGVQLEEGSIATPFEFRSYGQELTLCQRYYERSTYFNFPAARVVSALSSAWLPGMYWVVTKRAAPTVVIYSRNGTANKVSSVATGADVGTSVTPNVSSECGFHILVDSGAGFTTGAPYEYCYTASAEL